MANNRKSISPAANTAPTFGNRSTIARAYRNRLTANACEIRNAAATSAATASIASITHSSLCPDQRAANNSPNTANCSAAARFSARADADNRSNNAAGRDNPPSNIHSIMPKGSDK
ncbi:hypothetical protein MSAS_44820 [Mycobacterium saskatchewanense]|nr:hypothetical protein MSAS_44820 [Mycobacterium saskatchewanense]